MIRPAQDYRDFGEAVARLAAARIRLIGRLPKQSLSPVTAGKGGHAGADSRSRGIARVRLAIARAAARVPWRSDCLVQALAARAWLKSLGIPCELRIGARNAPDFAPHAWLTSGGEVVVGGDVRDQAEFYPARGRQR